MAGRNLFADQEVEAIPSQGRSLFTEEAAPQQVTAAGRPATVQPSPEETLQLGFEQVAGETGPLEAGLIGAGKGLITIMRGLGLSEEATPDEEQAFEALEEERPIATTIGEVAGEAAPFLLPGGLVAKAATIPGRVAASAALGAAEAGTIAKGRGADEFETLKTAGMGGTIAGALEVALPVVGRVGGKLVRRVMGKNPTAPVLDAAGNPSAELASALDKAGLSLEDISVEARRQINIGDVGDPAALARREFLEAQGITPTRAQITGGAADFQSQQELAKTSGRVRRAIEEQEDVLSAGFENAITLTGGSANRSNSTAIDFIADRSIDLDSAIGGAYKAAREAAPTGAVVAPGGLASAIDDIAGSDRATGGLAGAANDILKSRGIVTQGKEGIGKISAEAAEEVRKDMNSLFNSLTPFGRQKLSGLKNALDEDVAKAVGVDVFADARSAKAAFEKDLRRAKVNKFDTRKKNLVRDILENKVNPDKFLDDAILSKSIRSDDVEQLKRFLHLDKDGPGIDAWNDIRAEAMQRIRDTSFNEVGGQLSLSRAGLEKAINKFGRDKMRVIFSKDERKFINDMLKTSKLREPVRGTALGRGPSAQAIGRLEAAVKRIPLVSGMFEGLATDTAGRVALRAPSVTPLRPSKLTGLTPIAVPAAVAAEEQEQE